MWRGIAMTVLVAACDDGKRPTVTLLVDKVATIASDGRWGQGHVDYQDDDVVHEDRIDHLTAPALALNAHGLVVTWQMERRTQEEQSRIVAQRLSHDLQAAGNAIEVGFGANPSAVVRANGYVLGWADLWTEDSITLATIARDGSVSKATLARGSRITGTPSIAVVDGAVTAVACSYDYKRLVIAREAHGSVEVEQRPMQGGCNDALISRSSPIVLVHPSELERTDVIDLGSRSSKPVASPTGYCIAAVNVSDMPTLLCLDKAFGTEFAFLRTRPGHPPFMDRMPIRVRPTGKVTEARAVAVDQGIIVAWTTDENDEVQLSAALVGKDGSLLAPAVKLGAAPKLPRFDLVGSGSSAWIALITEQNHAEHDVLVARLRISGR
jgi:hypothetical protein